VTPSETLAPAQVVRRYPGEPSKLKNSALMSLVVVAATTLRRSAQEQTSPRLLGHEALEIVAAPPTKFEARSFRALGGQDRQEISLLVSHFAHRSRI
jgi:hypothetical protein